MTAKPDRFQVIPGVVNEMTASSPNPLNYDDNVHGDFFFDDNSKEISFLSKSVTEEMASKVKNIRAWLLHTAQAQPLRHMVVTAS